MHWISGLDIGTRRFYTSDLPLDDPFGVSPFRKMTFWHHFQGLVSWVHVWHKSCSQTSSIATFVGGKFFSIFVSGEFSVCILILTYVCMWEYRKQGRQAKVQSRFFGPAWSAIPFFRRTGMTCDRTHVVWSPPLLSYPYRRSYHVTRIDLFYVCHVLRSLHPYRVT